MELTVTSGNRPVHVALHFWYVAFKLISTLSLKRREKGRDLTQSYDKSP